jgi:hypothetical protein
MNTKKCRRIAGLVMLACLLVSGCALEQEEKKLRDVEYTVMGKEDLPEELLEQIEENKEEEFRLSYQDGEYLYIVRGYGTQPTTGYNITVEDLYLTEHALVFDTELTGPAEGQEKSEKETTPYIVVKTEAMDCQVTYK